MRGHVLRDLGLRRRLVFLILAIMVVQLVAEITPPEVSTPPLSALRFIGPGGADAAGPGSADVRGFVRVIDGDTMDVIIRGHRVAVGLLGVQAPMGNTDCGRAATAALQALVRGGIHLDDDASITFDSRLRRMYHGVALDGKPIGEQLARAGLVVGDGRGQHGSEVLAAEVEARSAGRGCAWQGLPAPKPGPGGRFSRPASDLEMFARNIGNALAPLANARLLGPSPAAAAPNPAISLPPGFTTDLIVGGLVNPTAFTFLQDGRILVALKNGVVRVIKNGVLLPTPFIDIRDHVNDYFDRGLLGIAVSPTFNTDGYVYLMYTFEDNASQYPASKAGRLTRVTAVGDTASPSTEFTLLGTVVGGSCESHPAGSDCIPNDQLSHTQGNLKFATDGSIFLTLGDGSSYSTVDPLALRAQSLDSLAGKMIHILPNGLGAPENPFYNGDPTAIRSKVWAYGLRNSFRFTLRPSNGRPYLGDVGWNAIEELDAVPPGSNLGWPCYEGPAVQVGYQAYPVCQALYSAGTARAPLISYDHSNGSSAVTGGVFYTGTVYPAEYQGTYFYGDYGQSWIRTLRVDANDNLIAGSQGTFATGADGPVDFEIGLDQNIYYLAINTGEIRRIRFTGNAPPTAIAAVTPNNGLAPLAVQFSSAGTFDPEGDPMTFSWNFGDGTPNSSSANPSHTYSANGTYTATLTATATGGNGTATARVVVGNLAPTATITNPSGTLHYAVGDTISFSGTGNDPESGAIPSSGLSWQVIVHHCPSGSCHTHFLLSAVGSTGQFTVPDHGDDSYLEFQLTATDSNGLTGFASVSVFPRTSQLTLTTSPAGKQVIYDGASETAPLTRTSVVGSAHSIDTPSPQGNDTFLSWSDGGLQHHNIVVGATNATYTANFRLASLTSLSLSGTTAYAEALTAPELNLTGDWTIEAWFKDETPGGYNHDVKYIIIKGDTNTYAEAPYLMGISYNSLFAGSRVGWVTSTMPISLGGVSPNAWHHAAASYIASTRQLTVYLDGVQAGQGNLAAQTSGNGAAVSIGRNGTTGMYWQGKLDDVRIWNVARSASEIATNYRAELASSPASLVANWKFNEGTGTVAGDTTVLPQHASLLGGAGWSADVGNLPPGPDTTPPIISAVSATAITTTGATIGWTTDEAADTQVEYGTTTAYGSSTTLNTALVTSHSQALSGLAPNTPYHYRVKSRDAANNLATSGDFTFTTTAPDTTPPVISAVSATAITTTGATIGWTTNEAADTQVEYGTTTAYGSSTTLNTALVTSHTQTLSGLSPNTPYHYRVKSKDAASNLATSSDFTFTTAAPDTTPPVISGVSATGVTNTAATIGWTTDESSDSQVEYGTTTAYGSSTTLNTAMVATHSQTISGLAPNTPYHYRVKSKDAANNLATSGDFTFTTSNAPSLMSIALSGAAYAEAPNATELNITGDWTLEAWFRDESAGGYNHDVRYIAMKGNTDTNGEAPYMLGVAWNSLVAGGRAGWTTYNMTASLAGVSANAWHHAAAVFIASTRQLTLYIDGVQAAQGVLAARTATGNGMPVEIGRNGSGAATWQGKIDDVRIWNVARTGAQISANYSGELASPPTSLVGNWKFNDGSGTTAVDATTTPQNATLFGATWSPDVGNVPAPPDTTPPLISAVSATAITTTGATIGWTTDEASDSQVEYGTTTAYGSSTTLNTAMVATHSQTISGLAPNTPYHYRVKSKDAANNLATSGDFTFTTAAPDTTPPVISAVSATAVTTTGATIGWTTNEAADTQVEYGTTTAYGSSTTLNTALVTSHSQTLSGLTPNTPYHYRVLSRDAASNLATSSDFTFTTAAADTTPPVISAVAAGSVTNAAATISWTTDESSDSQVEYGTTTAYGSSTTLNTAMVTSHSQAISGLAPNTPYHYRVKSRDAANNLATSADFTFTTTNAAPLNSLALSGTGYAEAPNATELNITGDWTLEAWFRDETPGGYNHEVSYIAMKGNTDNTPEAPFLFGVAWNGLFAGERTGWANYNMSASLVGVSANAWHHAAAVFVASTRQVTIYLDGVQVAQGVLAARTTTGNGLPVEIGRNGSGAATWRGKLDDVRIWNVARTGAQIAANYQAELASPPTGLVGNWKFNDGSGTIATDSTTTPQNANLVGGATWSTDIHP